MRIQLKGNTFNAFYQKSFTDKVIVFKNCKKCFTNLGGFNILQSCVGSMSNGFQIAEIVLQFKDLSCNF